MWSPLCRRVHFVRDRAGFLQCGIVWFIWLFCSWSTIEAILLPCYKLYSFYLYLLIGYSLVSFLCVSSLIRSSLTNPGRIDSSVVDESDWTYCGSCARTRPPRAHHCRRCKQCVTRMDHHCPWINNCVGSDNQFLFVLLVFYACLLSLLTFLIASYHLYSFEQCPIENQLSFISRHRYGVLIANILLAILLGFLCSGLFVTQCLFLLVDITTLEWFNLQEEYHGQYPPPSRVLSRKRPVTEAFKELCGLGFPLFWLSPFRRKVTRSHIKYELV